MTRLLGAVADRMVGAFAPKATAQAGCSGTNWAACYCSGIRLYSKQCTYANNNCNPTWCGSCQFVGNECA